VIIIMKGPTRLSRPLGNSGNEAEFARFTAGVKQDSLRDAVSLSVPHFKVMFVIFANLSLYVILRHSHYVVTV
jgi:hypothetical protein